jgi:phosphoribosylanthranilate isomerase
MVDSLEPTHYDVLKKNLPGIKLVQVVHVLNEKSVEYAIDIAKYADALLLDSGNPEAKIKELGGTGRTHDWRLSAKIRKNIDKPLFLAGGLNSDNVAEAIRVVNPFGIDVCSGVRTNDTLDEQKLRKFMQVVRKQQVL